MTEEWREVPGYSRYLVSDLGNVRNRQKFIHMKLSLTTWGYKQVNLCKNGKQKTFTVHKLVAMAFLGERPKENNGRAYDVNHKDGDKTNNALSNLEYITKKENIIHSYKVVKTYRPRRIKHANEASLSRRQYATQTITYTIHNYAGEPGNNKTVTIKRKDFALPELIGDSFPQTIAHLGITIESIQDPK